MKANWRDLWVTSLDEHRALTRLTEMYEHELDRMLDGDAAAQQRIALLATQIDAAFSRAHRASNMFTMQERRIAPWYRAAIEWIKRRLVRSQPELRQTRVMT